MKQRAVHMMVGNQLDLHLESNNKAMRKAYLLLDGNLMNSINYYNKDNSL